MLIDKFKMILLTKEYMTTS